MHTWYICILWIYIYNTLLFKSLGSVRFQKYSLEKRLLCAPRPFLIKHAIKNSNIVKYCNIFSINTPSLQFYMILRKHSNMLIWSSIIFFSYYQCWKQLHCIIFFGKHDTFLFGILLKTKKFKRTAFIWRFFFVNVFTVNFWMVVYIK